MITDIKLTVDWGSSEGEQEIEIKDRTDLMRYIFNTLECNAQFDNLSIQVKDISIIT